MNKFDEFDELDEYEVEKIKRNNIAITVIAICFVIVVFCIAGILFIKEAKKKLSLHTYYVLDIDKNNKQNIISLLEEEDIKYCVSITKIELYHSVHNAFGHIYCRNEETIDISFNDDSDLVKYIHKNSYVEKR